MGAARTDAVVYSRYILAGAPRLLGQLDRELWSTTRGLFDRDYWAWKFRDCPVTMFQTGVHALALLWSLPLPDSPYHRNARLAEWILGALSRIAAIQGKNGAFELWGPHTHHAGVTLAVAESAVRSLDALGDAVDGPLRTRLDETIDRAARFAVRQEVEDYAFISNHWAQYALGFQLVAEHLGRPDYRARAEQIVAQVLREQSAEGWYREYGGPDPGYESLGIAHLATYWARTRSDAVLESLVRCLDFYAYCVHPDGSVGGTYGSRHTQLYAPAGLELLAPTVPRAAAIAAFMRRRLAWNNVTTPQTVDAQNLATLLASYLEAWRLAASDDVPASPLPCQDFHGIRRFDESGITIAATPSYYAVINARKGGVCRVFDRDRQRLAYEDAGYVVRSGRRVWTSQILNMTAPDPAPGPETVVSAGTVAELRQELPTVWRMIALRALNVSVFRSRHLAAWVQRRIIRRLITVRRAGPILLRRQVTFLPDQVRFEDALTAETRRVAHVALARGLTSIHMGSARYFHLSELEYVSQPDVTHMAGLLRRTGVARCSFTLDFPAHSRTLMTTSPADANTVGSRSEVVSL